jgi:hypothetical protein
MAFRLVSSGGNVVEPTVVNLAASGVIWPGSMVDWVRSGTGGAVVAASSEASTQTMIFGVAVGYVQGASDTQVGVIPFNDAQLWEVDCTNSASTAQTGIRHALSALAANKARFIHNTATDIGASATAGDVHKATFLALAMTGLTTGSGKLIGRFLFGYHPVPVNTTIFLG